MESDKIDGEFDMVESIDLRPNNQSLSKDNGTDDINEIGTNNSIEVASLKSTDALHEADQEHLDNLDLNADSSQSTVDVEPELSEIDLERQEKPLLQKFMLSCQTGDLQTVKELVSNGEVDPTESFSDGISGLHWAAINNRLSIVKYLCENDVKKCNPNAIGGDLKATPLHWAARNGLTYIVEYLLRYTDADPSIRDSQSYNTFHLAIHSSNILLVIYMVLECCLPDSRKKLYIDEPDSSNRTGLHWAAYQGDIYTINCLLKFGADAAKVDDSLFIPLHWGFMRGQKNVLKSLAEAGSDIFLKNDKGKNSFEVAKDMNCYDTWIQVLNELGRTKKNEFSQTSSFLDAKTAKLITFFTPYLMLPIVLNFCSFSKGYVIPKIFISSIFVSGTVYGLGKYIIPSYCRENKALVKSPFLAGVFSATFTWCVIVWFYNVFSTTLFKTFLSNIILIALMSIVAFTFYKSMFMNPGYVPTPSNNLIILQQIYTLLEEGKYDINNFSIDCYVRKPLRLKYSRSSNQLVARFDHYCPWVYNEVGVRNHKLFLTFVYALVGAIILFTTTSLKFFHEYEGGPNSGYDSDDDNQQCSILSDNLCIGYKFNSFHFNMVIFALFQLIWVSSLVLTQTFQIFKGLTTYEFSTLGSRSDLNIMSLLPGDHGSSANLSQGPQHRHNSGFTSICQLLGLDQFVMTLKLSILQLIGHTTHNTSTHYNPLDSFEIPTDYGWKTNLLDFWVLGDLEWRNVFYLPIDGENNLGGQLVDYYKLYEYPSKAASLVV